MRLNDNLWPCLPTDGSMLPSDVQVCAGWLDVTDECQSRFWSTLSRQERERAGRFASERDRAHFVAGRGLLRAVLSSRLGTEPASVDLLYCPKGKPSLGGDFAGSGLQFNLAHSGGLAVFAVARHGIIGVDVEHIRPVPELPDLLERFCSERECAELKKLSGEEAVRAFFRVWTRKEAWLKATGEGITGLPKSIEVFGPAAEPRLCDGPQADSKGTRLCLHDLAPAPGFLGALAVTP